jgi:hypothetical protein
MRPQPKTSQKSMQRLIYWASATLEAVCARERSLARRIAHVNS